MVGLYCLLCRHQYLTFVNMAFIGRVLLNHIRHVPKARILSAAACTWQKLPVVVAAQARMSSSALSEGKLNRLTADADSVVAVCASLVICLNFVSYDYGCHSHSLL